MSSPVPITFVTGNANKLCEVRAILGVDTAADGADEKSKVHLRSQNIDLVEVQGATLEEISRAKCLQAVHAINAAVLVEDTALCFKALNGLPGAYIKWFLKSLGHTGLNNLLAAYEDKSAEAVCTFAYWEPGMTEPVLFQGRTPGKIVPARGPPVFGWDAVFQPDGFDQTYAEMDKGVKNRISHRGRALAKVKAFLEAGVVGGKRENETAAAVAAAASITQDN